MTAPTPAGLQQVADALLEATRRGVPVPPVRDRVPDLDSAYAVQELVIAAREGATNPRVGRKVGLTSAAVQRQLGVDQPDFGVLLAEMDVSAATTIDVSCLVAPRIEAELAFVLGTDLNSDEPDAVRAAVAAVRPALEIVDSRIAEWDIRIVDTVADNASSGLFVLGEATLPLSAVATAAVEMTLAVDGTVVSRGTGAACLGDPLNALAWVARTAIALGRPLRAGEVVLSGALGPMVPFTAGTVVSAAIRGVGEVGATAGRRQS
jgi:2-keto-4-pentenoate hydratase